MKKVLFPLLSLFLAFQSFQLCQSICVMPVAGTSPTLSVWIAILVNLFVTGIFAFVGFAYPTSRLLPKVYYERLNGQRLVRLGKTLGIEYFKRFLLATFWGSPENRQKYFDGTAAGLKKFDYQSRQSEFGHLAALVGVTAFAALMVYKGQYLMALITSAINIIFNFYPVVLQRIHRVRIQRLERLLVRNAKR